MKTDLKEIEQKLHALEPAKLPDAVNTRIEKIFERSDPELVLFVAEEWNKYFIDWKLWVEERLHLL